MMMSQNRVYNRVIQFFVNSLVGIFYFVAPILPRKFLRAAAVVVITPIFLFRPKYRKAVVNNLRIILKPTPSDYVLNRLVFTLLCNFGRYFVDLFYFRKKSEETINLFLDEVHGVPDFEKTLSLGKGAVLLTAHLGNWELGGYFLGRKKLAINVVYFPDRFSKIESFRSQSRKEMHVKEINVGEGTFAGLPIIRALRENEIVAMQGDRDFRGDGVPVRFFDRMVKFPSGPVMCAMAAKSPLVPVFILSTPQGKYKIIAQPPLFTSGDLKNQAHVQQNVQQVATVIEQMILQYPEQWYCFYPFFTP
ncbi:lysophospholipid acyltransferase family protein [candidate division CSSED10-310 bacterium]|uniref:Lysophospholipid acyltransferase family protein n=1 Tax=candidate division CSSED10-310 bacterium TaxID=2855610 RepID=A0ABV6YWY3_UNCC1